MNRLTRGKALVGSLHIDTQDITVGDDAIIGDDLSVGGNLTVDGSLILGDIQPTIAKPAGQDDDLDTEARAAIDDIIDALIAVGIIEAPSA